LLVADITKDLVSSDYLGRLDENDPATSLMREQWLLRALGYDPFCTAKAEIIDNQTYAISHRSGQRRQALGLSPLNADLLGSKALSYIDGYAINDYDLLTAIKNLSRYDHVSVKGYWLRRRTFV
jgi:hypothetical protein